ncbi:MAG TPA: hypothetical protein VFQ61_05590 [Polyangiaceae bacterium]|nr:hypothetical protein [Polyangiaceae bacterium]
MGKSCMRISGRLPIGHGFLERTPLWSAIAAVGLAVACSTSSPESPGSGGHTSSGGSGGRISGGGGTKNGGGQSSTGGMQTSSAGGDDSAGGGAAGETSVGGTGAGTTEGGSSNSSSQGGSFTQAGDTGLGGTIESGGTASGGTSAAGATAGGMTAGGMTAGGMTAGGGAPLGGSGGTVIGGESGAGGQGGSTSEPPATEPCTGAVRIRVPPTTGMSLTVTREALRVTSSTQEVVPGPILVQANQGSATGNTEWCASGESSCNGFCNMATCPCIHCAPTEDYTTNPVRAADLMAGVDALIPQNANNIQASCIGENCSVLEHLEPSDPYSALLNVGASQAPTDFAIEFEYETMLGSCQWAQPATRAFNCAAGKTLSVSDKPWLQKSLVMTPEGPVVAYSEATVRPPPPVDPLPPFDSSLAKISFEAEMGTRHPIFITLERDVVAYPSSAGLIWTGDHLTLAFNYYWATASAVSLDLQATQLGDVVTIGQANDIFREPFTAIPFGTSFATAWVWRRTFGEEWLQVFTHEPGFPQPLIPMYTSSSGTKDYGASLARAGQSLVISTTTQRSAMDIGQDEGPRCQYIVYDASGELGSSSVLGACMGTHRLLGRSQHAVLVQTQSDGLKLARLDDRGQLTTPLMKVASVFTASPSLLDAGPGLAGVLWSDGEAGHFALIDDTTLEVRSNVVTFYASAGGKVEAPLGLYSAGSLLVVFDRDGGADALPVRCAEPLN